MLRDWEDTVYNHLIERHFKPHPTVRLKNIYIELCKDLHE